MRKKSIVSIIGIFLIICSLSLILTACSGEASYRVIKIFSYSGTCNVIRDSKELAVQKDMKIKNEDTLDVKANSNAILKLDSDKFVCVKENSKVKFVATGKEKNTKTRLHVLDGGVVVEVKEKLKDGEAFEIASSNSVMAIRGTQISFDVETTEDTITSTFSILTGNTEIFLYKDETMNSTSLVKDYMMSYTTSLIKSTDEIYKIYDSTKHEEIPEEELETVYNVKKTRISNKKINEMVEIVNDFEKIDEEIVNGVINLDTPLSVTYGVDPKTLISVLDENKYIDFNELEFKYSKTIDGTYNEFDSNDPLSAGNWYVIVSAGNAYKSDPYEFRVSEKVVSFEIPNTVPFKTDPKTLITSNEDISNYEFGYSTTIDGSFGKFDINNAIYPGYYYVKVITPNYTSEAIRFEVVNASISISLRNSSVTYKTNPSSNVTVADSSSYTQIKYGYSQNANGPFNKEYSSTSPLGVGTWYVRVTSNGGTYVSNILSFDVVPANLDMTLSETDIYYEDNILNYLTINGTYDNVKYYYSTSTDGEYIEFSDTTLLNVGTYYLKLDSNGQYISSPVEFVIRQKQINYTISSEVGYRVDPSTAVTITSGTYTNVTYEYSTSSTGPFAEFDSTNPLSIGSWYIKVSIDSNYFAQVKSFNVVQLYIDYDVEDEVPYRTNPSTMVTLNGTYPTITYLYSTSENGTYAEYSTTNPLTVGTYYIKLVSGDVYISEVKSFDVVQAEITYSFTSTSVEYGTNPNTIISLNGTYPAVTYKYSTTSTGTYAEYDSSNPLSAGTYYVKLFINDNYTSTAKQFSVTKKLINFTITSPITYGENIISKINVTGSYDSIEYYYSTSSSFTNPNRLTSETVLNPNTYYIKLESGNDYESAIKSFVITAIEIDYTVPSEIAYATDPSRAIRINGSYQGIIYTYSQSTTGTFREYSDNNRLTIGTWYVKLTINDGYTAEIKSFEVVKANQAFELSSTSIPYGDDLSNYITDSLNRNIMISTNGTTYSLYDPTDTLSVGTYYIKLENDYYTSSAREIEVVNKPFTVSNIIVNNNYINANIKSNATSGVKSFKVTYTLDKNDPVTTSLFNDGDRYYFQVMGITTGSIIKFKYLYYLDDEFVDETDYYTVNVDNQEELSLGTDFELTESRSAYALHTFNSDGTINLYYDLGFVNNTSYDLVCEVTYGNYSEMEAYYSYYNQKKAFTTDEFLTLTDLTYRSWAVCGIRVLKVVNGIYYVAYDDYEDEDYENAFEVVRPLFDAKAAADGTYTDYDSEDIHYELTASFNSVLEVNGVATVTVKVTDYNWDEVSQTINFTSTNPDEMVRVDCDEFDELYVIISYTRVTYIKSDLARRIFDSSHTSGMKINEDSQFEEVVEAMEDKYGITIKGSFSRDCYLETSFEPEEW